MEHDEMKGWRATNLAGLPAIRALTAFVLVIAAIVGAWALILKSTPSNSSSEPRLPPHIKLRLEGRGRAIQAAADEAAKRFDAVTDWEDQEWRFTATLRSALIRADGRPVFFVGSMRDVDFADGGHTVTLDIGSTLRIGRPAIRFRLACDAQWLNAGVKGQPGLEVVGVAAISDLQIIRDSSSNAVRPVPSDRQYFASGRCLELKALPPQ